jgi:hypothetical protein
MLLGFLLGPMLSAAPPLHVAGVVRVGIPPYDDGERLYRLEGDGCQALRVSEYLTLRRSSDRRNLGRLQVTIIKDGHALARLAVTGDTYPLKGDLAVRQERAVALPAFPLQTTGSTLHADALAPRIPKIPVPSNLVKKPLHQESIFFLKGSAELSPAARAKLRSWVSSWGLDGRWALLVPAVPELPLAIAQARVEALREAMKQLRVVEVELRPLPAGPSARYDAIRVSQEAW